MLSQSSLLRFRAGKRLAPDVVICLHVRVERPNRKDRRRRARGSLMLASLRAAGQLALCRDWKGHQPAGGSRIRRSRRQSVRENSMAWRTPPISLHGRPGSCLHPAHSNLKLPDLPLSKRSRKEDFSALRPLNAS